MDKPFSIGLTGGIGSGKSLVADMFAALGATLIDTDQIAHQLTAPGGLAMPAIAEQFGPDFIAANGAMDRTRMRAAVFSDAAVKRRLEAILHPLIRIETERAAAAAQGAYRIFVVPLLVESGKWKERVSRVLVVDCPEKLQISRVVARNGLAEDQVRAIMAAQASRQARLDAADDVIVNDAGIAQLTPQVEQLHALYCEMARGIPQAN
jgi:dephospho-CoA kinase